MLEKFDSDFHRIFNDEMSKANIEPVHRKDVEVTLSDEAREMLARDKDWQQVERHKWSV
jgi:hypothetical protein